MIMNQFVKIFLVITFLALNALGYDYHQNYTLHLIQVILECGGLVLFAYYIINLDLTPSIASIRLLILGITGVIFKNLSLVIVKTIGEYYPVFSQGYGNYLFIVLLLIYALIIYYGIERKKNTVLV